MRKVGRFLTVFLLLLLLTLSTYVYAEQEETVSLEYVGTIKNIPNLYFEENPFYPSKPVLVSKNYLVVNTKQDDKYEVFILGLDSNSEGITIYLHKKDVIATSVSQNGRYFILESTDSKKMKTTKECEYGYATSIYIFDAKDVNNIKQIANFKACSFNYAFSPNGEYLALTVPKNNLNREENIPFKLFQLHNLYVNGWINDETIIVNKIIKSKGSIEVEPHGDYYYRKFYYMGIKKGSQIEFTSGLLQILQVAKDKLIFKDYNNCKLFSHDMGQILACALYVYDFQKRKKLFAGYENEYYTFSQLQLLSLVIDEKSNKLNKPAKVLFYKWDDGFKYLGAVQLSSGYATKKTLLHPYISQDESIVAFPIITDIVLNGGPNFYIDIYKLKVERRR